MTDLTPSRRNVIAALFAVPVCAATPALVTYAAANPIAPTAQRSLPWDDAVKAERYARFAHQQFYRTEMAAANEGRAIGTVSFEAVSRIESRMDELLDEHEETLHALMFEPAPDHAAVLYKMEVAKQVNLFSDFEEAGAAILFDLSRLAGEA